MLAEQNMSILQVHVHFLVSSLMYLSTTLQSYHNGTILSTGGPQLPLFIEPLITLVIYFQD